MSRELTLGMTISLDGFIAGPNGEMDWAMHSMSEEGRQWLAEELQQFGLIALGHKSYLAMADFWATTDNPVARPMNEIPKAVFSRMDSVTPATMEKATAAAGENAGVRAALESWQNPIVTGVDLATDVQRLKDEAGKPIVAIAGCSFASSLVAANLVNVFRLSVHPVALGRGIPLFGEIGSTMRLELLDVKQFDSGVVVKTYRPLVKN